MTDDGAIVNLAVLGGVGCLAYQKWDLPRWDRRIVSAVSVGLLTLWSGEGCARFLPPMLHIYSPTLYLM